MINYYIVVRTELFFTTKSLLLLTLYVNENQNYIAKKTSYILIIKKRSLDYKKSACDYINST